MPVESSEIIAQEKYASFFTADKKLQEAALKQATEIRRFEIELYWKRATYFWSLIAVSFVGYAAYFGKTEDKDSRVLLLIACLGLVFSIAWHCINKGSKYWQENWENHVELLEDHFYGPLYKSFARRPDEASNNSEAVKAFFVAPKAFSVSKINQLVSSYVAVVWIFLLFNSIGPVNFYLPIDWFKVISVALSISTCVSFWFLGVSHQGSHNPVVSVRKTVVKNANGKGDCTDLGVGKCEDDYAKLLDIYFEERIGVRALAKALEKVGEAIDRR